MSFAELQGFIRQDFVTQTVSTQPVDALTARLMVNNAQHVQDQSGQTICNINESFVISNTFGVNTAWATLFLLGPFPARLRPTSGAYIYRMRARIARTGAATVNFRFAVGSASSVLSALNTGSPLSSVFTTSINSVTPTLVTPTDAIVTTLNEMVPGMYAPASSLDDAANPTSVTVPMVWVGAAAQSPSGAQTARVSQLYVCEYVGNP